MTDRNRPDILNTQGGRSDRPLRSHADPRSLVSGDAGRGAETRRRLSRDHARSRDHRDAARPGGARRGAAGDRGAVPARDHLARLSGQPLPDEPSRGKPREQGLRRRRRSITRTAPTTTRSRSRARSTTAPFDQLFVLNEMERLGKAGSGSFLSGRVDASRTGIVGYSMGGYGVVNVDRRRLQQGERDDRRRAAEQAARRARRRQSRLPQDDATRASRRRLRSRRGACRRLLGRRGAEGHHARRCCSSPAASTTWRGTRRGRRRSIRRGQRRSLPADVRQRESQRRRADSGAGGNLHAPPSRASRRRSRTTPTRCGTPCG